MVSSSEDLICEVQRNAIRLFSISGNHNDAHSLRRDLASGFTRLSHKLRALRQRDGRFDHQVLFLEFKQAVTGDMAETTARPALQLDDSVIIKIDQATETLIDELHRSFNEVCGRHVID